MELEVVLYKLGFERVFRLLKDSTCRKKRVYARRYGLMFRFFCFFVVYFLNFYTFLRVLV